MSTLRQQLSEFRCRVGLPSPADRTVEPHPSESLSPEQEDDLLRIARGEESVTHHSTRKRAIARLHRLKARSELANETLVALATGTESPDIRIQAIRTLGRIANRETAESTLVSLLRSQSAPDAIALAAARSLHQLDTEGAPKVLERFRRRLGDQDPTPSLRSLERLMARRKPRS